MKYTHNILSSFVSTKRYSNSVFDISFNSTSFLNFVNIVLDNYYLHRSYRFDSQVITLIFKVLILNKIGLLPLDSSRKVEDYLKKFGFLRHFISIINIIPTSYLITLGNMSYIKLEFEDDLTIVIDSIHNGTLLKSFLNMQRTARLMSTTSDLVFSYSNVSVTLNYVCKQNRTQILHPSSEFKMCKASFLCLLMNLTTIDEQNFAFYDCLKYETPEIVGASKSELELFAVLEFFHSLDTGIGNNQNQAPAAGNPGGPPAAPAPPKSGKPDSGNGSKPKTTPIKPQKDKSSANIETQKNTKFETVEEKRCNLVIAGETLKVSSDLFKGFIKTLDNNIHSKLSNLLNKNKNLKIVLV